MTSYKATFGRTKCHNLVAKCLATDSLASAGNLLRRTARSIGRIRHHNTWGYWLNEVGKSLEQEEPRIAIFSDKGNSKLPFHTFSTLPIYSCPGMGTCRAYCYSLTSWRYPLAFLRQLQNTILLRSRPDIVRAAFWRIPHNQELRLYVDGDLENIGQLRFWLDLLEQRPDVQAYGYSKSWEVFLEHEQLGGAWPNNYALNLSSGSRYDVDMLRKMRALPISRGEFIAVPIAGKYPRGEARYAEPEYHNEVRRQARAITGAKRVFSCGGKCGTCTAKRHACGDLVRFSGVPIAIGVH